jgi:PII-like signaling protein
MATKKKTPSLAIGRGEKLPASQGAGLAPKFPTVAEIIDASLEINKFVSESTQQELTKAAKKITGF